MALQFLDGAQVRFGQGLIEFHLVFGLGGAAVVRHHDVDPPARQLGVDLVPDARLELNQLFRQIDPNIALPAVDRVDFRRELEPVLGTLAVPVTRHGSHKFTVSEYRSLA